ncbi:helix-turn-helix domain-containing protein [Nanoarchaeota archaeon]
MKSKIFHHSLTLAVKIILFLSILNALYYNLWHIVSTNIFLLLLMFLPQIMKKGYKVKFPREFEILLLIFVIATFFIGRAQWAIVPIFFGIAMGFVGFMILLILYSDNKIRKDYFMIVLFALSLSISLGFGLELLKYYLKLILGYPMSDSLYAYTMNSMTYVLIGAIIAAILGYIYMKKHRGGLQKIVERFIKTNPKLFAKQADSVQRLTRLIKKGESENFELKSTLRINLFTKEKDSKIEHSVLKTIIAFLNSGGGTLIIGVSDKGKVIGIEKDDFPNKDKFLLHFTNLIKKSVGKEYLPFIEYKILSLKKKDILKVDCLKSNKPVFLKLGENEEFYIRAGPSSAQLSGRNLVEYIEHRFQKKE